MKVKEIIETGFYTIPHLVDTEDEQIFEVIKNSDEDWVKENPDAKLIIDTWYFDYMDGNTKVFQTDGILQTRYLDLANVDVEKTDRKFEVFGNMGAFLKELQ